MDSGVLKIELPAEMPSLGAFQAFMRRGAERAGFSAESTARLELVMEELLVNIARYGYPNGRHGSVEATYLVESDGCLWLTVVDSGEAFDPTAVPDPDVSTGIPDRPIGGLGIFLVRRLVDNISYRRDEQRNILSFRFRDAGGPANSTAAPHGDLS